MEKILSEYGMYGFYIGGVIILVIIISIFRHKALKNKAEKFIAENPDAAKVFLTSKALITSEAVTIHSINGELPVMLSEIGKNGFYALPGTSEIAISYSYTRPGVMYKEVTKSTGMVTKEIEVEANKSYILSFNRKKEEFVFEELN